MIKPTHQRHAIEVDFTRAGSTFGVPYKVVLAPRHPLRNLPVISPDGGGDQQTAQARRQREKPNPFTDKSPLPARPSQARLAQHQ